MFRASAVPPDLLLVPPNHSLVFGDRSPQSGRAGAGRKDAIPASAMEAPAPSLSEEDLTEVKKDVSSSARLGAAGRAGTEESGNPEPGDAEPRVGGAPEAGHSRLHPGSRLGETRRPRLGLWCRLGRVSLGSASGR